MRLARTILACTIASTLTAGAAMAQTKLEMTAFGGSGNLPLWVAIDKGLFAKEGLKVKLDRTKGSKELYADVMANRYPIASAAFDNTVAYTEGQGDVKYDNFDVVAFMGVHGGLQAAVARPEIKGYADVKGKTIAVDSPNSGYALLAYKLLDQHGLKRDQDYQLVSTGNTESRMKAMKEGKAVFGLLSAPTNLEAKALGYTFLGDAAAAIGDYQGSSYIVRRSWAKDNEKTIIALIRGVVAAHDYIFTDKEGAKAVLQNRIKDAKPEEIEAMYAELTGGRGGLNRKAEISIPGVKNVLALRSQYGQPKVELSDPNKYIDLSYYDKAMKGMK